MKDFKQFLRFLVKTEEIRRQFQWDLYGDLKDRSLMICGISPKEGELAECLLLDETTELLEVAQEEFKAEILRADVEDIKAGILRVDVEDIKTDLQEGLTSICFLSFKSEFQMLRFIKKYFP